MLYNTLLNLTLGARAPWADLRIPLVRLALEKYCITSSNVS